MPTDRRQKKQAVARTQTTNLQIILEGMVHAIRIIRFPIHFEQRLGEDLPSSRLLGPALVLRLLLPRYVGRAR